MKRDSTDGNDHHIISIIVIVVYFVMIKRLYVWNIKLSRYFLYDHKNDMFVITGVNRSIFELNWNKYIFLQAFWNVNTLS